MIRFPVNGPALPEKAYEAIVPKAYHGTQKANSELILLNGFRPEDKPYSYLGKGVYFFDGDKDSAKWWVCRRRVPVEWVVFEAAIKLGKCLDLVDKEVLDLVKDTAIRLKIIWRTEGKKDELTDAGIINYLADELKSDSVRCINVPEGEIEPLYKGSKLQRTKATIIICIRKIENILTYGIVSHGSQL
jgi:hypothetical protein